MSSPSPICLVNASSTTNGVNVSASSTVTVQLASSAGVNAGGWTLSCTADDNISQCKSSINSSITYTSPTSATFTAYDGYMAIQLTSTVNGGRDVNGVLQPSYSTTFGVYVTINGTLRLQFVGETVEGNANYGWTADQNAVALLAAEGGGGGSGFIAGGDLSGTSTNQTVSKVHGATVPAAGSLTTGNVLQVNGSSALEYAPVNLAGGSNFVTGTLPTGNQADQSITLTGDVTSSGGNTGAATTVVTALQGNAVKSGTNGSSQDGYALTWHNASSQFQVLPQTGGTPVTFSGDLTGTNSSQTIVKLSGASVSGTPSFNKYLGCFTGSAAEWQYPNNLNGIAISATAPTAGQVLTAESPTLANWQTPSGGGGGGFTAGGDLSGTSTDQTVIAIQGNPVSGASPTAGQLLIENSGASGSVWTSLSQDAILATGGGGSDGYRGVNLASGIIAYSSLPASSGSNYLFADSADISYLAGKGINFVRLNFSFEAMQAPNGSGTAVISNSITATSNTYCTNFFNCVEACLAAGFYVMIEPHQYNSSISVSFTYNNNVINNSPFTYTAYANLWSMIATACNGLTNGNKVMFGLMNEPNSITTTVWTAAIQAAINAIRATGNTSPIVVPPFNYSSALGFFDDNYTSSDTTPAAAFLTLTDSYSNLVVGIHSYFDGPDYDGESNAIDNTSIGVTAISPIVTWAASNSAKFLVSEFAADSTNGIASTTLDNMYSFINSNSNQCIGGAWWSYTSVGFGGALFDLQPTTPYTVDAPDMALFTPFLVAPSGTIGQVTVQGIQTVPVLATAPTTNQVLTFNGTAWHPATPSTGGISALTTDVTASGSGSVAATVVQAQGGELTFGASTGTINAAIAATAPGLTQTTVTTNSATAKNMAITAQSASGTTSVGGNVVLTAGTGTSTNGSVQFVTSGMSDTIAPSQGTKGTQLGTVVQYTGFCTVLDNTVQVLSIPLPGGAGTFSSVSLALQGIWRVTTTTGKGSVGTQMLLTTCANINGTVSQQGTGSNIAGPAGSATYNSEITFGITISGTNIIVNLVSTTATNSFDCTVLCTAVFN